MKNFKKGDLVTHLNNTHTVLVTEVSPSKPHEFSGVVVETNLQCTSIGVYCDMWSVGLFKRSDKHLKLETNVRVYNFGELVTYHDAYDGHEVVFLRYVDRDKALVSNKHGIVETVHLCNIEPKD